METNWRSLLQDPDEVKIFEALENPQWDWRTIEALSRESGKTEKEVRKILAKYASLIKRSSIPSADGQDLYTLQSRYYERKGLFGKAWDFLSSSSSGSTGV